jgi:hypothetical protein
MRFWYRSREKVPALVAELQKLEQEAEKRLAASRLPYHRSMLAGKTGVTRRTLSAWFDGRQTPRDTDGLMKAVRVLAVWAEREEPDEQAWRQLQADARKAPKKSRKNRLIRYGVTVLLGAAAALGTSFLTPVGGYMAALILPSRQPPENLTASASWCCTYNSVEASEGLYWPGSPSGLATAMDSGIRATTGLVPAGVGLVEIPLQTNGGETIFLSPPQVVIVSRRPNVAHGIIGIVPRGGQGGADAPGYTTDVDAADPVTVAAGGGGSSYQYVSSSSPEIMMLAVHDTNCDCTFDIRLSWQAQGRTYSQRLTNGGRHFRMLGAAGLAWYSGDPLLGVPFKRDIGSSFWSYA